MNIRQILGHLRTSARFQRWERLRGVLAPIAFSLGMLCSPAQAQVNWAGGVSTDWLTPGNWTPATVPAAGVTANINSSVTPFAPVISVAGGQAGTVTLGTAAGQSGQLTITGPGTLTSGPSPATYFAVGDFGSGTLLISGGGTLTTNSYSVVANNVGSSGTATVTGAGSLWTVNFPYFGVGESGTGTLNVEAGGRVSSAFTLEIGHDNGAHGFVNISGNASQISVGGISVGSTAGSTGEMTVTGAGAIVNGGPVTVGAAGTGTFTLQTGASATASQLSIANPAQGTATLQGAGTFFTVTNGVRVGVGGLGKMDVLGGAKITSAFGQIGINTGANGAVTVSGTNSAWTMTSSLGLGQSANSGVARLDVLAGGLVSATSLTGFNSAAVNVSGSNSRLTLSAGFTMGASGATNRLDVAAGGAFSATTVNLSSTATSAIQGNVSGTGTTWSSQSVTIGGPGSSTLVFTDNATASIVGEFIVDGAATTKLTISNGAQVTYDSGAVGGGQFRLGVDGYGELLISNGGVLNSLDQPAFTSFVYLGRNAGSSAKAVVTGAGSQWTTREVVTIGNLGNATLDILNGATVTGYDSATIAFQPGVTATVTVSGTGSKWTLNPAGAFPQSSIRVGVGGNGTLKILAGAEVNAQGIGVGSAFLPIGGGILPGTGYLLVSGATTRVNLNVQPFQTFDAGGNGGTGTIDILDGAQVTVVGQGHLGASVTISGAQLLGKGVLNVDGVNSRVTYTQTLDIGEQATGELHISGGGFVSNSDGYVGSYTNTVGSAGNGTVTVAGTGSQWQNSGNLRVGDQGSGTLDVTAGGKVTNANGFLAYATNSSGTATVSGTNSLWTNSGTLAVGRQGTASLSIAQGGLVSATGVTINALSSLHIGVGGAAGTLNAPTVANAGLIRFNHTGTTTFGAAISGAGTVNKIAAGTTILTGAGTYTGATSVDAGTLLVNGSLGNTALNVASGATLGGSGTIAGSVTIANGGILAPGTSPGTLTVGSITLNNTSQVNYELGAPFTIGGGVNDLTIVNGNLVLDGILNITDAGGFAAGTYRLFNYTGSFTDQILTIGTLPAGFNAADFQIQTSIAGQVNLIVALAGDRYWDGPNFAANGVVDGGTSTWNNASSNWTNSTGTANGNWQTGIAIFSAGAGTVTLGDDIVTNGLRFEIGSGAYTIETSNRVLTIGGAVTNLSGATQTLVVQANGQARFINTASAGNLAITVNSGGSASGLLSFENTATAGNAAVTVNGGGVNFLNTSKGGSAVFTVSAAGVVNFQGSSTAENATVTTKTSGVLQFTQNSTGGSATITNEETGSTRFDATGGFGLPLVTAASAQITNRGATVGGNAGGLTTFAGGATAGSATVVNNGGAAAGASGGTTEFLNASTAATATFTNNPGAVAAGIGQTAGGSTIFRNSSTAGSATLNNLPVNILGTAPGSTAFHDSATAGTSTITNSGGILNTFVLGGGGRTTFDGSATAGTATISNNAGTVLLAGGGQTSFSGSANAGGSAITNRGAALNLANGGVAQFEGDAAANTATITSEGGTAAGAGGGRTVFIDSSGATSATLIANGGTAGGSGGTIEFWQTSTGGTSTVQVFGNGNLDISQHALPGVAIGSIEGTGLAFLGARRLSVGTNDFDKVFSGVMQDGGTAGGVGGELTKVGSGVFTLAGSNTYTGATTVNGGILRLNGSTAAASTVTVNSTATLAGIGTANGAVTIAAGGHLAPGNSAGTITVGSLTMNGGAILDYELAVPGVVGGGINDLTVVNGALTLDGVINVTALPGFTIGTYRIINYTGLLTDNALDIGLLPGGYTATVDVSVANEVNLIVTGGGPLPIAYWNGLQTTPNGVVNGGTGTWSNAALNWTNETGTVSGTWGNGVGIFSGAPGTVTVAEKISFTGLQFTTSGYVIVATGGAELVPTGEAAITTAPGVAARIEAPITGSGGIVKEGAGSVTLTAANTYTGDTSVNGGSLFIDGSVASPKVFVRPSGLLGGHGLVFGSVFNAGVVSPGNSPGAFQIKGNYTQTSAGTLRIEVAGRSAGQFDKLEVGGQANLDGTLELVRANKFKLRRGDRLKFLTAEQGVNGRFARVINPFTSRTILRPTVVYEDDAVLLAMVRDRFVGLGGLTPNQRAIAHSLDNADDAHRTSKVFAYLDERLREKLPGDFDKIAPEELASIFTLGAALDRVQSANLQRRTDDVRNGAQGFTAAGLAMRGSGPGYEGEIAFRTGAVGPRGDDGKDEKKVVEEPAEKRWGAFLTGLGEWVNVDGDANARGYELSTGGFTLGIDYKLTSNFALGVTAGYAGTDGDLANGGNVRVNGGKLGLYATYFTGGFYVDGAVSGGFNSYDIRRTALRGNAYGDTEGGEFSALVGTGYDWKRGALTFGPTASFQYTYTSFDGFAEHGSLAPLSYGAQHGESLRTALGMRASYDWKVGGVLVRPEIRAAWQHEFANDNPAVDASLAGGAGGGFLVHGPEVGRDSALIGAGVAVQWSESFSTFVYYDGEVGRAGYGAQAVSVGVRAAF